MLGLLQGWKLYLGVSWIFEKFIWNAERFSMYVIISLSEVKSNLNLWESHVFV